MGKCSLQEKENEKNGQDQTDTLEEKRTWLVFASGDIYRTGPNVLLYISYVRFNVNMRRWPRYVCQTKWHIFYNYNHCPSIYIYSHLFLSVFPPPLLTWNFIELNCRQFKNTHIIFFLLNREREVVIFCR